MKTQNATIQFAPGQSTVNNLREMLSRKSETMSRAFGCNMTVGETAALIAAALPAAAALVLASAAVYGWAAAALMLALNLAAPAALKLWKEGGEA